MTLFFITGLFAFASMTQGQTPDFKSVTFESMTRGGNRMIQVTPDSVVLVSKQQKRTFKTDKGDWQKVVKVLESIKLNEIEKYPAPTSKRSYDGAWHSTLQILDGDDKQYSSNSFDDEVAPKELSPLMKCLKDIETRYQKK